MKLATSWSSLDSSAARDALCAIITLVAPWTCVEDCTSSETLTATLSAPRSGRVHEIADLLGRAELNFQRAGDLRRDGVEFGERLFHHHDVAVGGARGAVHGADQVRDLLRGRRRSVRQGLDFARDDGESASGPRPLGQPRSWR